MANRTDTQADTVHGTNPQYLVDRIVRLKIHNDAYWKEFCFALTNETLIDQAAELDYVAGTYGGRRRPAKFLCLLLKMLQIQPDDDVVMEYIKQPDLKYLRALGVVYLRLTGRAKVVYETLEPLYADYRKLRYRNIQGKLSLIHMDELIDWLFNEETIVDVTMPALPKREILENSDMLKPRESILDDDLEDLEELEAAVDPQKPASLDEAENVESSTVAPSTDVAEKVERRSATPENMEKERKAESPARRARASSAGRSKSRRRSRSRKQENEKRARNRRSPSRSGSHDRKDRKKDREKKEKIKEKDREKEREKEREREKGEKRDKKDKKEGKKDKKRKEG